jgi:uncharacterized protein YegL
MTNPDYTAYLMITDVSGSMWSIMGDAEGGIRQFVTEQDALPGKATLSFYEFNTEHTLKYDFAPLAAAKLYTMVPSGGTALLDAVGTAVTEFGQRLADMPEDERPGKVMVFITTDGEENRSTEWTHESVKALLTQQQEQYGWAVSYAGANVDAFAEAAKLGVSAQGTMSFAATGAGVNESYTRMTKSATAFRTGTKTGLSYDDKD